MLKEIWEGQGSAGASAAVTAGLRLLSFSYNAAVALRNHFYDREFFRPEKLPCSVVSVGNITVGGTGKTPTAILLARLLKEHGHRPAVLSRGYGGRAKSPVNVVSDGNRMLLGWREAGDEPVMIAGALPGVPVLTGPKRSLTGKAAVDRFGADVLVLDDAFQHRSLFRDIDIVLIAAVRPFGNGFLLPRGPLREPPKAMHRAGILLRTGDADHEEPLREVPSLPSFRGRHRPKELVEAATGRVLPLTALRGQQVFAFAGIGSPENFRQGLTALGAKVAAFRAFPDHHPYSRSDIEAIRRLSKDSGATRIVTTEKDAVRLMDFPDFQTEISLLRVVMEITSAETFAGLIFSRLEY